MNRGDAGAVDIGSQLDLGFPEAHDEMDSPRWTPRDMLPSCYSLGDVLFRQRKRRIFGKGVGCTDGVEVGF